MKRGTNITQREADLDQRGGAGFSCALRKRPPAAEARWHDPDYWLSCEAWDRKKKRLADAGEATPERKVWKWKSRGARGKGP